MTKMKINLQTKSILLSRAEAQRAKQHGTPEHQALCAIRNSYPDFQVVIRTHRKSPNRVIKKPELSQEDMDVIREMYATGATYAQIKQWFLSRFPEFMYPAA